MAVPEATGRRPSGLVLESLNYIGISSYTSVVQHLLRRSQLIFSRAAKQRHPNRKHPWSMFRAVPRQSADRLNETRQQKGKLLSVDGKPARKAP